MKLRRCNRVHLIRLIVLLIALVAIFAPVIAELKPRLPKIRLWVCVDGDAPEVPGARSLPDWK